MTSRPTRSHRLPATRRGYTLVEILVALTLTLILMSAVVRVFGGVGESISKSRRALEQFDRQRTCAAQLNNDFNGVTARLDGRPGRPEEAPGYFEVIEGAYLYAVGNPPYYGVTDPTTGSVPDYTVGQRGDMLMFTCRNPGRPFVGRFMGNTITSDVAEICWFLRGNRLHRRVLLIVPGANQSPNWQPAKASFYANNDISAHITSGNVVPNSLADLTKRENRFGHDASKYPFDITGWYALGLPTLAECSSPTFMAGWQRGSTPSPPTASNMPKQGPIDMWDNTAGSVLNTTLSDQALNSGANDAVRIADDVILNNVIGFDVKVWEPAANSGAGGYVDLGYGGGGQVDIASYVMPQGPNVPRFQHSGVTVKGTGLYREYDTGCFSYENEGIYSIDSTGKITAGTPGGSYSNGLDDDNSGVVDDQTERLTSPPYPVPLRGIQVKIRCFEPDSRQIREVTVEHDFLPK